MNSAKRFLALVELALLFPSCLFMGALFVRNIQPPQYQPAASARRVVDWFSARPVLGLDIGLITLPLAVLIIGTTMVVRAWRSDAGFRDGVRMSVGLVRRHLEMLLVASATVVAACILGIVALHVLTD